MSRSMKQTTIAIVAGASNWLVPVLSFAQEHAEHAETAEHGGHGGGLDFSAMLPSLVNFVLLIGLFVYMFRDSVSKALKSRRAEIEQALTEAARLKAEAEAKHKEYSERMARLDEELAQIRKDMISAGEKERDRIVAEAEQKASRMRKEAQFLIEQHVKQLRADLTRDTVEAAVAAAEQLLLKATTSYDQQRLAQEYLAALNQNGPAKSGHTQTPQPESRA